MRRYFFSVKVIGCEVEVSEMALSGKTPHHCDVMIDGGLCEDRKIDAVVEWVPNNLRFATIDARGPQFEHLRAAVQRRHHGWTEEELSKGWLYPPADLFPELIDRVADKLLEHANFAVCAEQTVEPVAR